MQHRRLTDIIAPNAKNILFCILFSFLFWYDLFLPQAAEAVGGSFSLSVNSPLALLVEEYLPSDGLLAKGLGFLLYLLLCFVILRLNEVFSFIRVRTILPSLFCLITGGILLHSYLFFSGIIVALLVVMAVFFSFKLLMEEHPKYAFNVSLLLFTAALFSFSCVWLLIVFWLFTYSANIFSFRIFLASLLGALTSVLYAVIGFGIAGNEYLLLEYVQESFRFFVVDFQFSLPEILYLAFVGFLILLSLVDFMIVNAQENIKPRKEFSYLIALFFSVLTLIILSVPDSGLLLWLAIVFGSFLLGRYFSLKNNLFTKVLLSIYFGGSLLLLFFT